MPETFSNSTASETQPLVSHPNAFSAPVSQPVSQSGQAVSGLFMKPYLVGAVIAGLVLVLVYQQIQISHLSKELNQVSDSMKSSDVRTRLESQEASLGELNTRLAYLDSKINATDQKASVALSRIKAHEDADIIGNAIKGIKQTFGIK